MSSLLFPAPAKINLFLHILGKRHNGYHDLQTCFQLIDYSDNLSFTTTNDQKISLTCLASSDFVTHAQEKLLNTPTNLIIKAAEALRKNKEVPSGVHITLYKRIPLGSGLGGGSSDAATTLQVLNKLWNYHYSLQELTEIALTLGADVPLFVKGATAFGEGLGEKLTPLLLDKKWYVIIVPPVVVSTAEIFSHAQLTVKSSPITIQKFLRKTNVLRNDCESIVRQLYPVVAEVLDWLSVFTPACLTGTGACVFGTTDTKIQADTILQQLPNSWRGFVSQGILTSPVQTVIENWGVAKR